MDKTKENIKSRMSQRLIRICDMLRNRDTDNLITVADIGCDHGYISMYLVQNEIADRAIAMDIRKGPLEGADRNIREYGLDDRIVTRLSDGLKGLSKNEADACVIAGMGGKLMMKILKDNEPLELGIKKGVLQPQSEICEFRRFLRDNGYHIADENMILDEGKYYFPMLVYFTSHRPDIYSSEGKCPLEDAMTIMVKETGASTEDAARICDTYGEHNLLKRDPLLKDYCSHGLVVAKSIISNLDFFNTD